MKNKKGLYKIFFGVFMLIIFTACTQVKSKKVYVTSEDGDKFVLKENISFKKQKDTGSVVVIDLENKRQEIDGIGASLTESSAFVLASISKEKRAEVLENLFGEKGANFPITRTHIGSCDFSVEGKYSYAEVPGDTLLEHFSLDRDREGFSQIKYQDVVDTTYDLLPLIKEVSQIKKKQNNSEFRIMASPWSAPAWMKDNNDYFSQGWGGILKEENYEVFTNYFLKYFEEMRKEDIEIWAITPVNEPEGNNGSWESMHFWPVTEAKLIAEHLGPKIIDSEFSHIKIFGYDQNRDRLMPWADEILGNPESAKYTTGMAVHWYASTYKVFEEILDSVHIKYPNHSLIHSEGCIDNLGCPANPYVGDPDGWVEKGWFLNDKWWWEKNASDWGYTTSWGGDLHPIYVPVHRYARNIIVSINNWLTGFIDWNIVLDKDGGPNHVGNFCGAPVMIDTKTDEIHFTPVYDVLMHFSKTIRPGDVALRATPVEGQLKDSLYVCATLNQQNEVVVSMLNVTQHPIEFLLQLGEYSAKVITPKNAIQTIIVPIN